MLTLPALRGPAVMWGWKVRYDLEAFRSVPASLSSACLFTAWDALLRLAGTARTAA